MYLLLLFFFFKQKTAYEMRISDWSSDVCSSDLSSAALPIFGEFMANALSGKEVPPFRIPPGVSLVRVNPSTGRPAQSGEPAIWEAFRPGPEPFGTAAPAGSFPHGPSFGNGAPAASAGTGGLYKPPRAAMPATRKSH